MSSEEMTWLSEWERCGSLCWGEVCNLVGQVVARFRAQPHERNALYPGGQPYIDQSVDSPLRGGRGDRPRR